MVFHGHQGMVSIGTVRIPALVGLPVPSDAIPMPPHLIPAGHLHLPRQAVRWLLVRVGKGERGLGGHGRWGTLEE
jgi:hypothetical protein